MRLPVSSSPGPPAFPALPFFADPGLFLAAEGLLPWADLLDLGEGEGLVEALLGGGGSEVMRGEMRMRSHVEKTSGFACWHLSLLVWL